jgi:predicted ATP-dependent protease
MSTYPAKYTPGESSGPSLWEFTSLGKADGEVNMKLKDAVRATLNDRKKAEGSVTLHTKLVQDAIKSEDDARKEEERAAAQANEYLYQAVRVSREDVDEAFREWDVSTDRLAKRVISRKECEMKLSEAEAHLEKVQSLWR